MATTKKTVGESRRDGSLGGRARPRSALAAPTDPREMVQSIIKCKWSLHVLACVRRGVNRPGAMVRANEGLTSKVLQQRLRKLVRFGIIERRAFPEIPPRVEYSLTPRGARFARVLDLIETLAEP